MSDYLNANNPPELLPDYLADPQQRKQFEAQKARELESSQRQASQNSDSMRTSYEGQLYQPGEESLFIMNNRARPVHIPEEEIIIDGQLSVSARGPFIRISKKKFNESYQLQGLTEKEINTGDGRKKKVLEMMDETRYKKEYRDYLSRRTVLMAEYAKEQNNVARHEDGSIDQEDSMFEISKVNYKALRAQG